MAYNAAVDLVERNMHAGRGNKVAFVDDGGTYTFAELAERVNRCANALRALGLRPGDRIILGLLDSIAFPTAFLGAIRAGIIPIPVNTMFSVADYAFILESSGAAAAIVAPELYPAYAEAAKSLDRVVPFIIANGGSANGGSANDSLANSSFGNGSNAGLRDFDSLVRASNATSDVAETTAQSECFWLYSSGSTGRPKGTVHRHASLARTAQAFAQDVLGLNAGDVVFSAAKLFFAYGLGNALSFPLAVGATSVLLATRPTADAVIDIFVGHRPTVFYGVPTLFSSLLSSPRFHGSAPFALRLCTSAGEALPARIGETWRAITGVDIIDGIGSTEMLHIFLSNRPGAVTYGATGLPVPGYRVRLVDDTLTDVDTGELGELLVAGPSAFSHYWDEPERTERAFAGEWVRTGDKFCRLPSGEYVHCGRVDDMIKAGGIWVAPTEVEAALMGHAAVQEVGVIGAADANELVKPKAYVVLRPGYAPSSELADELRRFVKGCLAPYKCPRWIEFVEELPKTATGKIQRHRLRAREAEAHVASA
jgi:benzoate-CoA ligase